MAKTFVLIGGAWIGSWAWSSVSSRLRADGHVVFPATLTGLGERVHLARPEIDLETHITDVCNLMLYEDLTDVTLVGHSYSGIVVSGVADRLGERLAALVFCDSAPFAGDLCYLDVLPPPAQAALRQLVDQYGDGWRLPFPGFPALGESASLTGLSAGHKALMEARAVAQPFGTYTQPLRLTGSPVSYERVIINCEDGRVIMDMLQQRLAAGDPTFKMLSEPGWRYLDLETGHWPMLSEPEALAAMLAQL